MERQVVHHLKRAVLPADGIEALDVIAENFEMGPKKLGRLELLASEQDDDWSIEKLKLITPESTLTAEGEWHNWKRNPNTRINLSWDINDIGKTLVVGGGALTEDGATNVPTKTAVVVDTANPESAATDTSRAR